MQTSRYGHGCGTIDGSGSREVVVAGHLFGDAKSVEIYSFYMDSWRTGEELNCYRGTCKISLWF